MIKEKAEFVRTSEAICSIPSMPEDLGEYMAYGYDIALSNDGVTVSNQLSITLYNSTCVDCVTATDCSVQVSSLFFLIAKQKKAGKRLGMLGLAYSLRVSS